MLDDPLEELLARRANRVVGDAGRGAHREELAAGSRVTASSGLSRERRRIRWSWRSNSSSLSTGP
eukprot:5146363-Pyramimonas_sp.AAC.1